MSTMYDALRKAEAERKKTADPEKTSPTGGNDGRGMPKNIKAVILLVLVVVAYSIAFYRIKGSWPEAKKPVNAQTPILVQMPGPTVGSVNAPRAPGTYDLDGVIDAGKDSLAIINGKLVKLEDSIDNLILKKVSPKEVELLNTNDHSTVVLKIK